MMSGQTISTPKDDADILRRRIMTAYSAISDSKPPSRSEHVPEHRLLVWSELPEWRKEDSSHVASGYRVATPSVLKCLKSWAYLHNESVNIFSHLFGAALFFALPLIIYQTFTQRYADASTGDTVVFAVYLLGVAICLVLSVAFHTLSSHSARGLALGIQLDFQGIILLIWGATVPMVYYTLSSEPKLRKAYWVLISCSALAASIITFTPAFHAPATKPLRAGVFGSLALSTLTCVAHGLLKHGWVIQSQRFPMWSIGLTLVFNTLGATVYVLKFPERWWPRKYDIFGASHQLMHCAIIIAGLAWLAGMIFAYDNAHKPAHLRIQ